MKKILFVCTLNLQRSKTAEDLYKHDPRFEVKSAGVSKNAVVPVSKPAVEWADLIIVMEPLHERWFEKHYPSAMNKLQSLDIHDVYYRGDEELVALIKEKFEGLSTLAPS